MHNLFRRIFGFIAIALIASACQASSSVTLSDDFTVAQPTPDSEPVAPAAAPDPEPTTAPPTEPDPEPTATAEPDVDEPDPDAGDELNPDALAIVGEDVDWRDCGDFLQCGSVDVPADYSNPDAGTIRIAINVLRSQDPDERLGYLFINPGGPGGSGTEIVSVLRAIGFTDEILDAFDVIGFDPRGVGLSEPTFACGVGSEQFDLLAAIGEEVDNDDEIELGNQAAQLCLDSMGPVGNQLGSEFVARDMDEIRKALGAEQISYLGFSYGSALGGWYASIFPERVRAMVVDGAANPLRDAETLEESIQLERESYGPIHEQLGNALASCDSDACPIWNDGDPEGYWYDMVDKFDVLIQAEDGSPDAPILGIVGYLYDENSWSGLHQSIYDLAEFDDPSGFVVGIDRAILGQDVSDASVIVHINCLDSWSLFPDDTTEQLLAEDAEFSTQIDAALAPELPLLFAIDTAEQFGVCPFYEAIDPPAFEGTFDGGGIPILVIGNTSDPVTSFVESEQYANEVLADGRLVKVEHPQHTVYPANTCVNEYVHAALIDLEYPTDEPECAPDAPLTLGDVVLEPLTLPDGSTTVLPAGWLDFGDGLYALSNDPDDPVLLLFQSTFGDPDDTLATIEGQVGLVPEVIAADVEIGAATWAFYNADLPEEDLGIRFAISDGPNGVLILVQSFLEDIETLTDLVLQPAVEQYQPPS